MFGVVYMVDVHGHPIDHLFMAISLGLEGSGFGEPDIQ
jgi:hypothetical protein